MKHFFSIGAIILALMAVTLEGCAQKAPLALTKEGIGCLKFRIKFDEIPTACEGFYDRCVKSQDESDGFYVCKCYRGNELVAEANSEDNNRIFSIIIYSTKVSTPEGVYAGMPIKKLLTIKGGDEAIFWADTSYTPMEIRLGENNLYSYEAFIHDEQLTDLGQKKLYDEAIKGTGKVKLKNSYFKPNAKVSGIIIYPVQ